MADITAACLLKHRRMLQCRRATFAISLETKLSQGRKVNCEEIKMRNIDGMLGVLCRYNADATLNCLTNAQVCGIIQYLYKLLPEAC
jgi:hypothetical protein